VFFVEPSGGLAPGLSQCHLNDLLSDDVLAAKSMLTSVQIKRFVGRG
jgi:hypothetical protein